MNKFFAWFLHWDEGEERLENYSLMSILDMWKDIYRHAFENIEQVDSPLKKSFSVAFWSEPKCT